MRIFFLLIAIIISVSSCQGESPAESDAIYMRMSVQTATEHPYSKAAEYFARLVGRRSEGRIQIMIHPEGSLGDAESTITQVGFGGIALALIDKSPEGGDALSRNGILQDTYRHWDQITERAAAQDMVPLSFYNPPLISVYSARPYDISGVKRVGIIGAAGAASLLQERGIAIRTIDAEEAYASIANGYIDAAAEPFLSFYMSGRYPLMKSVAVTEAGGLPCLLVINKDIYDSLEEEDRSLLMECARLSSIYANTLLRRAEEKALEDTASEKEFFHEA